MFVTFSSLTAQVKICTAACEYEISKPAAVYRLQYSHLAEAAHLAAVCHDALAPSAGGSPAASLAEVVAKLSRAKVSILSKTVAELRHAHVSLLGYGEEADFLSFD